MEERSTFQDLILRHLNDPENLPLTEEVNRMRGQSAHHEKEFQDSKKIWDLAPRTARLYEVDEERSMLSFKTGLGIGRSRYKQLYTWLSTAAAVFIIVALGTWLYMGQQEVTYLVKETSAGKMDSVVLADGSQVFLAENTALRYPKAFKTKERQITLLKGKAFFKIERDPKHPFEVSINHSTVRVLGTSFNINYTTHKIDLSVKTGRVMFSPNRKSEPAVLTAGDALSYDLEKNQLTKENGINATGWLTKELHFVDMPLEEVCRQLSAYYDIKVVLLAHMSTAKKLNARFSNTSIDEVLKVLKETYPISVLKKDSVVYIKNL